VAGHLLGIHPFDQPNVQESKDNTNQVLSVFQSTRQLPELLRHSPAQAAKDLVTRLKAGVYVAILAYTTPSRPFEQAVARLRKTLVARHHITTTFGYGPRYLHSTGQLHKGGPATGLFLQLIDRMTPDLPIPGKSFSFGTLARAQAAGDLQSLRTHHRHALLVPLGRDPVQTIDAITATLGPAHSSNRRVAIQAKARATRRKTRQ
jgi:glucose-6-phosphate isomerase/transaldolase/glucose-6-phosphate isomerase